jgi:drug/metabolite transporter (DMT)-like permease
MSLLHVSGLLSALASAVVWGSGDFAGGMAAKRSTQYQVVALAALSGLVALSLLAVGGHESIPPLTSIMWASLAGLSGAIGMAALYQGLAAGRAAIVAPTSGVVGATLPVVVGSLLEGFPGWVRIAGMAAGIIGIWLVSKPGGTDKGRVEGGLLFGIVAGAGFGGFFVLIAQVQAGLLFSPLVVAKLAAVCTAALILVQQRQSLPTPWSNPIALLAGTLDAGGNVLYLLAKQLTRLDIAAVLASMYPAATVILSRAILHEKVSASQWLGVGLCLTAVGLIAVG